MKRGHMGRTEFSGHVSLHAKTEHIAFDFVHKFSTVQSVEDAVTTAVNRLKHDLDLLSAATPNVLTGA
jgi:hypothetical protein